MAKIISLKEFTHDPKLGFYTRVVIIHGYEIVEAKEYELSKDVKIISISKDDKSFSLYQPVSPSRLGRYLMEKEGEFCGIVVDIKRPTSTAGKIIGIIKSGEDFFPSYFTFKDLNDKVEISTSGMNQVLDFTMLNEELQIWSKDEAGALFQLFTTPLAKDRNDKPIKDYGLYSVHVLWGWKNGRPYLKQVLIKSKI